MVSLGFGEYSTFAPLFSLRRSVMRSFLLRKYLPWQPPVVISDIFRENLGKLVHSNIHCPMKSTEPSQKALESPRLNVNFFHPAAIA